MVPLLAEKLEFEDPYVREHVRDNFELSEKECPGCGGKLMKNTGQGWLDETFCPACGVFRDCANPGEKFEKPHACRPMIRY